MNLRFVRSVLFALPLMAGAAAPALAERVIVKCNAACDAAVAIVQRDGGSVTHRYKYVTAIAADVSDATSARLSALLGPGAVRKDQGATIGVPERDAHGTALSASVEADGAADLDATALTNPDVAPAAYSINNTLTNVQPLHAAGFTGGGVTVAVIDTGIRPGFPHINVGTPSVIGGKDFINDGRGFSNSGNNGHGTFVSGMIAAHVVFQLGPSAFLTGIRAGCPTCVIGTNQIPMIGTAPAASIYAVRVLGVNGSGSTAQVLAGMEHVLDLKRAYMAGQAETRNADGSFNALNIRVANMSLGGATTFAGQDVEDELTNAFLDADIVLVVAAGNAGPGGSTVGSPGTGYAALTTGAASTIIHEGILRNIQFGTTVGPLFRPFRGTQTAFFSSRGPNADGRHDPDIVANGFASFGQGLGATTGTLNIASGTSFATPTVSGVAAVLRQAVPNATALQVRNALIATADPAAIADGSGIDDRGAGFVNGAAARALLAAGTASNAAPPVGVNNKNVKVNLQNGADVRSFEGLVTRSVSNLLPGQRFETYYRVLDNAVAVNITVSNVTPGATQNLLFGDDILFTVHTAKTSSIGEGDYPVNTLTTGGTFTVTNPEHGLMRVTLSGDWTNASPIGATVTISSVLVDTSGNATAQNKIADGELQAIPFVVPVGAQQLHVEAGWKADWASYPANDLDVILQRPDGTLVFDAATLNNPEHADLATPMPGAWTAFVQGFSVFTKIPEQYKLRLEIDGRLVR